MSHSRFWLILSVTMVILNQSVHSKRDYQIELMKYLKNNITDYSPIVRPVLDPDQVMQLNFTFLLSQIVAVDSAKQTVKISAYLQAGWTEERLVWDSADFGNVTVMDWDSSQIWFPVILIYNGVGDNQLLKPQFPIILTSSSPRATVAETTWKQEWEFSCKFDMSLFPFDKHVCDMELFCSDQGRGHHLLQPAIGNPMNNELAIYVVNSEWRLLNLSTFVHLRYYEMLKGQPKLPLPSYVIRMTVERVSNYYLLNVVAPLLLLTLLQLLIFIVPVESGEKLGFGITIMLSYTVFLLLLDGLLPKSQSMPAVASFITAAMVLSSLSLLLTSVVIRFHFAADTQPMPPCLRLVFVTCLGRLLCTSTSDSKVDVGVEGAHRPSRSDWVVAALALERLMALVGSVAIVVIFLAYLLTPFATH